MTEVRIEYLGDLQCKATHGPTGSELVTDAPPDNGGQGRAFSPTDLVGTAMGTCMLTIMGIVARRHGIDLSGARVRVTKQMTRTPPRKIAALPVVISVPAKLTDEHKKLLENAALTCPVHRSLAPEVEKPVTFDWGQ